MSKKNYARSLFFHVAIFPMAILLFLIYSITGGTIVSSSVYGQEEGTVADQPSSGTEQEANPAPTEEGTGSEPLVIPDSTSDVSDLPQEVANPDADIQSSFPTENPKAPDAKVKIIDSAQQGTPSEAETESVNVSTPPEMEETIISSEKGVQDEIDTIPEFLPGFPTAQEALKEMYDDVVGGINTRHVNSIYETWKRYAASVLSKTNRYSTGLELNNRCRLRWYDQLYRNPISSVFYVEAFSRELYANLSSDTRGIVRGIRQARAKLDIIPSNEETVFFKSSNDSVDEAVNFMKLSFVKAANAHSRALAPLTPAEVKTISKEAFTVFSAQARVGHQVPSSGRAQYLIDLMDKMDYSAMFDAGETLIPLTDRKFLDILETMSPDSFEEITIGGNRCGRIPTPAGDIIVGGREDNNWDLDSKELENVVCLIDLGGNDKYLEGVCNPGRPIFVVLDLGSGDDKFEGTRAGIQGGAILGVSLLYDDQGDTSYNARDIAQGTAIGGIGILIDNAGNDKYNGFKRVQATAICGLGLLLDRAGNDDYHAALLAQAIGSPRGFGVLAELSGDDHYYVGGYYQDSYPEYPGLDGWGQGIGAGIRAVACGGIGAFLEGAGDDVYEYDYFAQGGGYWMGLGFARDFSGNDRRIGSTVKAYNGGNRTEPRHQRFSNGFGCHYSLGYSFDDGGNDFYDGTIMGLGMAWDLSAGFLVDYSGNDIYAAVGGLTQGTGAEGSLGFLFDYRGEDEYRGTNQGYAFPPYKITYHSPTDCGGNFSFVIDHGGNDKYGNGRTKNNAMTMRGSTTGFIIDRPTAEEFSQLQREGTEVALDNKSPLKAEKQVNSYNAYEEQSMNYMSDRMNPNVNSGNNGPGGFFGPRRGGGFWPF